MMKSRRQNSQSIDNGYYKNIDGSETDVDDFFNIWKQSIYMIVMKLVKIEKTCHFAVKM